MKFFNIFRVDKKFMQSTINGMSQFTRTLNELIEQLGTKPVHFAAKCGLQQTALSHVLQGKPVTIKTLKKVINHPDLSYDQRVLIAISWHGDKRQEIGMTENDFTMVPTSHEPLVRVTGDPVLVEALREIGMLAIRNKSLYRAIMSLKSAFIEAAANPEKDH